jgi:Flp pilus assembly protein TadG
MRAERGDEGAAVVDFVLVTVLVIALFLLVFQVGVLFHVRNVVTAAAAEGARYGATADRTPEDGALRAEEAIRDALGERVASRIRCTSGADGGLVDVDGVAAVEIVCRGPLPIVFLPTPVIAVEVKGHALEESR